MEIRRILGGLAAAVAVVGAFGAPAARAADTCPNAAYRNGPGANLPDCRAWEQVTPVEKGGRQPDLDYPAYPSPNGDRILFESRGNAGGGQVDGLPFNAWFSSVRGSAWSTFGVDAPADSAPDTFTTTFLTRGLSKDRSKVLTVSLRKLTAGAAEGASNVYARDTANGSVRLLVSLAGRRFFDSYVASQSTGSYLGGTPDLGAAVIASHLGLVPGVPDIAEPRAYLYRIGGGQISLVSRNSDGDPLTIPSYTYGPQDVSEDGRRVLFYASRDGSSNALYQRLDDGSTVVVSRSRRDDPASAPNVALGGASASRDGTVVTFAAGDSVDDVALTPEGTGPFYRWSAAGDKLVSLLAGVAAPWSSQANSFNLLGTSLDQRYVWFIGRDRDSADAPVLRIYLLDTATKQVSVRATFEGENAAIGPALLRFSPDRTKFAFSSSANITGFDQSGPRCAGSGSCDEAFYLDAEQPDAPLVCISCGPPGSESAGNVRLGGFNEINFPPPEMVADNGRVLFDTPARLTPADVNGISDVYEFTPGRGASLVSSGTGDAPATSIATTPSGGDLFFRTSEPLVAQDSNIDSDIYDARVGGGIAAQQLAPNGGSGCPSGDCSGPALGAPPSQLPGTATFVAPLRPPSFTVGKVSSAARKTAAATGRLKLGGNVGAAGRITAKATARVGRRTTNVGETSYRATKSGTFSLALKLSPTAMRTLARKRSLTVAIEAAYSRTSRTIRQTVTLKTRRARGSAKGGAR